MCVCMLSHWWNMYPSLKCTLFEFFPPCATVYEFVSFRGMEGNLSPDRWICGSLCYEWWLKWSPRPRQAHSNWCNQRHLAVGHMLARWLTTGACICVFVPLPGLAALLSQRICGSSSWLAVLSQWPQNPRWITWKWVILTLEAVTLWLTCFSFWAGLSVFFYFFFSSCFWICFEHFSYESLLWADAGLYMCLFCSHCKFTELLWILTMSCVAVIGWNPQIVEERKTLFKLVKHSCYTVCCKWLSRVL